MSQTSTIFFFLFAAFILSVTAKGELQKYAAVFYG